MPCFCLSGIYASATIAGATQYVDTLKPFVFEMFHLVAPPTPVTSVRTIPALKPDGYELAFVSRIILPSVNGSATYHSADKIRQ